MNCTKYPYCRSSWIIGLSLWTASGIVVGVEANPASRDEVEVSRAGTPGKDGPLSIAVGAFLKEDVLRVDVAIDPKTTLIPETDVELTTSSASNVFFRTGVTLDPQTGRGHQEIKGRILPPGEVIVSVHATHRPTGRQYHVERRLKNALHPEWLGTRVGISKAVPRPWTPIEVEGTAVKPWGRVYRFDGSPLPTSVVTRAASVLAAPIAVRCHAGGKSIEWKGNTVVEEATPGTVRLRGGLRSETLVLTGVTTVEYDGMVRVDLEIAPRGQEATIEELTLEVPLVPEHARYLYHFPGQWGSVANSGYLPKSGWAQSFRPYVWLGDEDRGLAWFCESDRNWFPADPHASRMLTVDREPGRVVLRCHLVERPRVLREVLKYTFGFQATPVKAPEKTVWDYRITHDGNYGIERAPAPQYPAAGHVNAAAGTFECWYRPAFDTERNVPEAQRIHKGNRDLFTIRWGEVDNLAEGTNCGLYWNGSVQGPVAWSRKEGKVLLYLGAPYDWKAGEWHHLAMTWGETVRIYADGKSLAEVENTGFLPAPPARALIEIGGSSAAATIDEVRILDVARAPSVRGKPLQANPRTLLLDHFDEYGQPGAATPGKIGSFVRFVAARFGRGPTWEPTFMPTQLQWLASEGVRTICFHEQWSPYQSYPYVTPENRPRLKSLVDACHRERVNLLLYMSRQLADIAPEWELYAQDVLEDPSIGFYDRQPPQKAYYVCWNSAWKDFCLDHLDKLMAEFGHDGWYLDGAEWPMACQNRHHGCGYQAPDGSIHPTWDIFATREFMKRLYVLTRAHKPDAQLNIHNSTVMVIPTLGWGTSSWDGEQLDGIKPPVKTLDILPMDAFRAEFMGRQWGVPSEFLVNEGQPYHAEDMLAYTLLHGVLIRPTSGKMLQRVSDLWKLDDEFPLGDAGFHPYWNNADLLSCTPAGIYATAYERPGQGLLIFVSNLGDRETEAKLTLHPRSLGWTGPIRASDALSQQAIPIVDDAVKLGIAPWRYRVLRLQPGK